MNVVLYASVTACGTAQDITMMTKSFLRTAQRNGIAPEGAPASGPL